MRQTAGGELAYPPRKDVNNFFSPQVPRAHAHTAEKKNLFGPPPQVERLV